MWVKTKRNHQNRYGMPVLGFEKEAGDVYDHPNPRVLLADGVVEEATINEIAAAQARKVPGSTTEGVGSSAQAAAPAPPKKRPAARAKQSDPPAKPAAEGGGEKA